MVASVIPPHEQVDLRVWNAFYSVWRPADSILALTYAYTTDSDVNTGKLTLAGDTTLGLELGRVRSGVPVPVTISINGVMWSGQITTATKGSTNGRSTWECTLESDHKHLHRMLARDVAVSALDGSVERLRAPLGDLTRRLVSEAASRTGLPVYLLTEGSGDLSEVEVRTEDSVHDVLGDSIKGSQQHLDVRMLLPEHSLPDGDGVLEHYAGVMERRWEQDRLDAGEWPDAKTHPRIVGADAVLTTYMPPNSWQGKGDISITGAKLSGQGVCWQPFETVVETSTDYFRHRPTIGVRWATREQLRQQQETLTRGFSSHVTYWAAGTFEQSPQLLKCVSDGLLIDARGNQITSFEDALTYAGEGAVAAWKDGTRWVIANAADFKDAQDARKARGVDQRQTPALLVHLHPERDRRSVVFSSVAGGGLEAWSTTHTAPDAAMLVAGGQMDAATIVALQEGRGVSASVPASEAQAYLPSGSSVPDVVEALDIDAQPLATVDGTDVSYSTAGGRVDISRAGAFFYRERYVSLSSGASNPLGEVTRAWAEAQGTTSMSLTLGASTGVVFGDDVELDGGVRLYGWRPADRVSFVDGDTRVSEVISGYEVSLEKGTPRVTPILGRRSTGVLSQLTNRLRTAERQASRALMAPPRRVDSEVIADEVGSVVDDQISESLGDAKASIQTALDAVAEMQARLDEGVDTSRFDELMEEHSGKLAALADDLLAVEVAAATRDERLTDLDAALADAAKDLAAADKALEDNAAALAGLDADLAALYGADGSGALNLTVLRQRLETANASLEALQTDLGGLSTSLAAMDKDLQANATAVSGLQSSLATANANIAKKLDSATYASKMTALDSSLATLNTDLSKKVSESVFNDAMSTYGEELALVGSAALEKGLLQPGNLVWNPAGKLDMNGVNPASPLKATVSASGGKSTGRFIMSWSGTPANQHMNFGTQAEQWFDIHQGQEFLVSAWVKPSVDLDAGALRLYLYSGGNYIKSPAMPAGVWTEIRGMVRIGSTTAEQRSYFRIWHSGTAIPQSATWDISDVFCTEMAGDLLVVDGAISAKKVAANAIEATHISAGAVTAGKIAANAVTATEIKAGTITATEIATGAITAAKIAANAVTANAIAANTITAAKIATGAITADELAANAVVAGKIATDAVTAGTIAAGAVTAGKIAAGAVTANEIKAGTITANEIATGAITAAKIAANTITAAKIATNAITADELAANSVVAGNIQAGAITTAKIAANAVTANEIKAGTITATEIASGAITTAKIAANAVTSNEIKAGTITASELASGSVTAVKIASNAVTAAKIAANTITAAKIAAGTITGTEIAANTIMANQLQITPGNLFPDPHFKDPSWSGANNVTPNTKNGGELRITADGTKHGRYYQPSGLTDKSMTLEAGAAYRLTANVYMANGINPKNLSVYMRYLHTDGSVKVVLLGNLVGTTGTTVSALNLTTPTAMKDGTCTLGFYLQATNAAGQRNVAVWDVQLTRAADALLIVDGAIQAQHIGARQITGTHIAAGAITAGMITSGTMSADRISGGTIDGSIIRAGTITATKVNADEIFLKADGDLSLSDQWEDLMFAMQLQNSAVSYLSNKVSNLEMSETGFFTTASGGFRGSAQAKSRFNTSGDTAAGSWKGRCLAVRLNASGTSSELRSELTEITATNRRVRIPYGDGVALVWYEVDPLIPEPINLKPSANQQLPQNTWTTITGMTATAPGTGDVNISGKIVFTNVHRGSTYGVRILAGSKEVFRWESAKFGPLTSLGNGTWSVTVSANAPISSGQQLAVQAYCSNSTASKRTVTTGSAVSGAFYY